MLDHGVAEHEVEGARRGRAGAPPSPCTKAALRDALLRRPAACPSRGSAPRGRGRPRSADSSASESAVPPPPQPASSTRPCDAHARALERLRSPSRCAGTRTPRSRTRCGSASRPRLRDGRVVDRPHDADGLLRRARGSGRRRRQAEALGDAPRGGGRVAARRGQEARGRRARARAGSCRGTTATSSPKISRSSSPPGLSVETTRRAAGQRLQGHGGRGLQHGREHEQVGRRPAARATSVVGHEPQEAHGARRGPSARRLRLERRLLLAGARDEQHARPAARARTSRQRAQQRRLVGQGMQALDVRGAAARRRARTRGAPPSRSSAEQRAEGVRHRRVDDGRRAQGHGQRPRALEQRAAVEGHVVRVAVEAPEARVLAVVVPDLGAVVRQHVRAAARARPAAPPPGSSRCWSGRARRPPGRTSGRAFHQVSAASRACGRRVARSAPRRAADDSGRRSRAGPSPKVRKSHGVAARAQGLRRADAGSSALAAWWGGRCGVTISTFMRRASHCRARTRRRCGPRAPSGPSRCSSSAPQVVEEAVDARLVRACRGCRRAAARSSGR